MSLGVALVCGTAGALAGLPTALEAHLSATIGPIRHYSLWERPDTGPCALFSGVAAGLVGARLGVSVSALAFWVPAVVAVPLALADLRDRRLPFRLSLPIVAVGVPCLAVAALVFGRWASLLQAAVAMVVVAGLFLVLALTAPGQLGLGDVVLVGSLALTLGWLGWRQVAAGLIGGLLLAAVAGVVLAARRRSPVRVILPLGPALLTAWLATILFA